VNGGTGQDDPKGVCEYSYSSPAYIAITSYPRPYVARKAVSSPGIQPGFEVIEMDAHVIERSAVLRIGVIGDPRLLAGPLLGFFSSITVPPDLILATLDFARQLRNEGIAVVAGFHAPLEGRCLELLLRGEQPIVVCLARSLERYRPAGPLGVAIEAGRVAIASCSFGSHRASAEDGSKRNDLVVTLADRVMVVHGKAGSRTYRTAARAIESGKEVFCFEHPRNADLILLGARVISVERGTLDSRLGGMRDRSRR